VDPAVVIFVIVLAATLCAVIARAKERGAATWFLVGVLLGPIGVIVALLVPSARVECPHCRERIRPAASVCPHCRSQLVWDPAASR
jgi:hypothetical protein